MVSRVFSPATLACLQAVIIFPLRGFRRGLAEVHDCANVCTVPKNEAGIATVGAHYFASVYNVSITLLLKPYAEQATHES